MNYRDEKLVAEYTEKEQNIIFTKVSELSNSLLSPVAKSTSKTNEIAASNMVRLAVSAEIIRRVVDKMCRMCDLDIERKKIVQQLLSNMTRVFQNTESTVSLL